MTRVLLSSLNASATAPASRLVTSAMKSQTAPIARMNTAAVSRTLTFFFPVSCPFDTHSFFRTICSTGLKANSPFMSSHVSSGKDKLMCHFFIAPPSVTSPPEESIQAARGATVTFTCQAVGVPTPIITWRLNWGHIPASGRWVS